MKFTASLTRNHEFRRLYNKGKSAASTNAVIYCRKNGRGENRLGITVSTKLGNAVTRNRIRRRLKEIYRINEMQLLSGYDIVIVARMKCKHIPYKALETDIISLMRKLRIIAN